MISHVEANELMDLYAPLLSARQQEILSLYFQEDFSLSEIQENLQISRAAVHDALSKGIKAMQHYESILHVLQKKKQLEQLAKLHPKLKDDLTKIIENEVPEYSKEESILKDAF